jgi:hypothetical protein
MRAAAGLQSNHARRLLGKELQQLGAPDLLAEDHPAASIGTMRVENMLRDVQSNRANFVHGRLPQVMFNDSPWHKDAVGGRPPHQIWHHIDIAIAGRQAGKMAQPEAVAATVNY